MDARLKTLVAQAHQEYDAASLQYLERTSIHVSCRKGCAFCCHAMVVLGFAEAEYLYEHLEPEVLQRVISTGKERLKRIAQEKNNEDFATRFFLESNLCPLLQNGACTAYEGRPLACRGVLTNLDARYCQPGSVLALKGKTQQDYQAQLSKHHGPEHYLKVPWQTSEQQAQKLWQKEQEQRGFTVIGELTAMLYLLHQPEFKRAIEQGQGTTKSYLNRLRVLGGDWGLWVG